MSPTNKQTPTHKKYGYSLPKGTHLKQAVYRSQAYPPYPLAALHCATSGNGTWRLPPPGASGYKKQQYGYCCHHSSFQLVFFLSHFLFQLQHKRAA